MKTLKTIGATAVIVLAASTVALAGAHRVTGAASPAGGAVAATPAVSAASQHEAETTPVALLAQQRTRPAEMLRTQTRAAHALRHWATCHAGTQTQARSRSATRTQTQTCAQSATQSQTETRARSEVQSRTRTRTAADDSGGDPCTGQGYGPGCG